MNAVPMIPENAPFTPEQRAWLNGFLAGVLSRGQVTTNAIESAETNRESLLIAFGSQSGNAESLAKKLAKEAKAKGFEARVCGMENINPAELPKEKNVMFVTSTWGEGEMPDNAAEFWSAINQNGASPKLQGLRYSVLALGDLNYGETFCLAGKNLDARLEELGAVRVHPRVDCDVEFDEMAKQWSDGVFRNLKDGKENIKSEISVITDENSDPSKPKEESGYGKKNPYPATLIANVPLNREGSAKDTRHIAFSLADSGLVYETGDALGVYVDNCPEVVSEVIRAHGLDSKEFVVTHQEDVSLEKALTSYYEIRSLYGKTPEKSLSPQEFVDSLSKLNPRLYSIASSLKATPNEVHLCVGVVKYELGGVMHKGVASTYLAERCGVGNQTRVFVHTAKHFRVPSNGDIPMIMVGPGTGIAPFRAFLQERQATGAKGRNWLFFGDQYRASDYLYEEQLEAWKKDGLLNRLDLAFSRDQKEKIYVQHRMLENGKELWRWLEDGANFYVCGDASRMAKDVDQALHQIIQSYGGKSEDEAAAYVADLKKNKRYARDVY